jgi:serine/threonine protein kinase
MPYIPHGMWPRLISRILGDTQLKQFILKQLAQPTPKSLKWHAWKTGAELRWNTQPILRLQETTGSLLSLPDLDPSLINVTVHDSYGAFNTADIIQSSKDVGVQLWVASDPIKACKLSDNDEVPDVNPTFSETIETYSHSASRRYSISAMNDFLVIDTENDEFQNIQDISMEEKRPDHKALDLQGQDLGYETCNQIQSGSTTSSSTNLPEDVNDAETRSVSSFINSYSSFSVTCRPDPLAVKLLTRCVAHIDTILQDWYHGMRNYTVHSFCQDCLLSAFDFYEQSKRRRSQAIELCAFSWKAAVQQAYRSDTISCVRHQDVPLAWIIPDVLFGDLSAEFLIKSSSLKQNHPLGKGGFSDVWSGKWHRQGQPTISVALKMLIRGVTDMNQHKEGITIQESHFVDALPSARSEVSFLSQLNHPHVVNLLGVCIRPLCVVLELAPLGSLEKIIEEYLLARWVISALSSQLVALQVARALDYLHSTMNVIYKDLKSDNVLVWRFPRPNRQKESCDGESVLIKLSDYGISQWANAKGRAKGFGGTEGYIAPEVYRHRGREIFTNKVDIFSYAMVLYELITLQPPMKDIQTDELERAYLSGRRPSMSRQHMDCRIFLRELMFWCWQQTPQDRPTAAETIQALESNQFLRLVGGLPVTERSSIHHAALHRGHRTKAVVEGEGDEEGCEVWICAGDEQLGTVTIVSKHGREIEQEDHSVCDSCIMCICSVNETMWIGSEMGSVYIYSANNRKQLTAITLTQEKRDPVMCIIHASKNRHVIIGMGRGGIHIFSDEISMINKLATPIKSVTLTNRLISCLALVPVPGVEGDTSSDHVTELWCGLTYGEIAVLDPCTLQSKCSALKVVPERQQRQRTRVHNMVVGIVSHLAMDCDGGSRGTRKTVVFCSIIKAGVVIKLFSESREIGGSVNVAGFLTERKEEEYKFSVESLFCQSSRMFVGTRSGHIVVINSETLSLISIFHGFCQSVTCIFAVPKSTWSLLPADFGHTTDEDDAVSGPSSSVPYVVSLGIGLQSYAQEQVDGSGTGFMLVWNVDSM